MISRTDLGAFLVLATLAVAGRLIVVLIAAEQTDTPFLPGRIAWLAAVALAWLLYARGRAATSAVLLAVSTLIFASVLLFVQQNPAGEPFVLFIAVAVGTGLLAGSRATIVVGVAAAAVIIGATVAFQSGLLSGADFVAEPSFASGVSYALGLLTIGALLFVSSKSSEQLVSDLGDANLTLTDQLDELEQLSSEIRRNRAELQAVLDCEPLGMLAARTDGQIVRANRALADILGFESVAELEQETVPSIISAHDRIRFVEAFDRAAQGETQAHALDIRFVSRGNRRIEGRIHFGVVAVAGDTVQVVLTIEDVTERNRVERYLERDQRHWAMSLIASRLAHDFNNLMAAVLAQATAAEARTERGLPTTEQLENIKVGARTAATLTKQLLTYSGEAVTTRQLIDPDEVIEETRALFAATLPAGVVLASVTEPDRMVIHADRSQLQQVIMNLLLNAAQAMASREGTVTITTRRRRLSWKALDDWPIGSGPPAPGDYLEISVADEGIGIDPSVVNQIFDPFFAAEPGGHGLGLSVVLGIVRSHGGRLGVRTALGRGTTISLILPSGGHHEATGTAR